jgi:hypothetical protein
MKKIIQNCIPLLLTLMMAGAIVILVSGREKPRVTIDRPEIPAYPMVDSESNYDAHLESVRFGFAYFQWLDHSEYQKCVRIQSNRNQYTDRVGYDAKIQKLHDLRQNHPLVWPYRGIRACRPDWIVWYSSELFGLPWTYYRLEKDVAIRIAFTDVTPQASMLETIQQWNPQFPSPQDPGTAFKSVTERTIQLRDRTVQALVTENAHFDRVTTYFMYDDMLIAVHGPAALCTEEWFTYLSFVALTQNNKGQYETPPLDF